MLPKIKDKPFKQALEALLVDREFALSSPALQAEEVLKMLGRYDQDMMEALRDTRPAFCLLGTDPLAPRLVRQWRRQRIKHFVPDGDYNTKKALRWAEAVELMQREGYGHQKEGHAGDERGVEEAPPEVSSPPVLEEAPESNTETLRRIHGRIAGRE